MSDRRVTDRPAMRRFRLGLIGYLVLALAMLLGIWRLEDTRHHFERDVCRAVPTAAGAGAQALVNVLVTNARAEGQPEARIQRTIKLGALYVVEARRLALEKLPDCPQPRDITTPETTP